MSDRKGEKLREKETQNRGRTEGLKAEKNPGDREGGKTKETTEPEKKETKETLGKRS